MLVGYLVRLQKRRNFAHFDAKIRHLIIDSFFFSFFKAILRDCWQPPLLEMFWVPRIWLKSYPNERLSVMSCKVL